MGRKKRHPQMAGGSASALSLSRPAQALLALQPAESLSRPRRPLSRGFGSDATQSSRSSASGPIDNYPGGTLLH
jgi:hypothetical protein